MRIAVVLPQPEGPTSTQISPAGTVSERLSTATSVVPGYRFVTLRNSRLTAVAFVLMGTFGQPRPGACVDANLPEGGGGTRQDGSGSGSSL
jgi:hypothetical protein